jgi:uncharacterized protein
MTIRKRIITDSKGLLEIINKCQVIFVGMACDNIPYVLPFNFGYEDGCFWIHGTQTGKKIDYLSKNDKISIALEIDSSLHIRHETMACSYSMTYKSIVASGRAVFIEDYDEKVRGMNIIMKHYTGRDFTFSKPSIDNIGIIKIVVEEITGHYRGA